MKIEIDPADYFRITVNMDDIKLLYRACHITSFLTTGDPQEQHELERLAKIFLRYIEGEYYEYEIKKL